MTDIEAKALALVNEEAGYGYIHARDMADKSYEVKALCRAIERHEAFKQEVSDAAEMAVEAIVEWSDEIDKAEFLHQFIIPKPKPDELVEVWGDLFEKSYNLDQFCAALEARGLEIREKGQ